MFSNKTKDKITLIQYGCLLTVYLVYIYCKYGPQLGNRTLICSVLCYAGALAANHFIKNNKILYQTFKGQVHMFKINGEWKVGYSESKRINNYIK